MSGAADRDTIRVEFARACAEAIAAAGGASNVQRAPLYRAFKNRGPSKPTIYRWLKEELGDEKPPIQAPRGKERQAIAALPPEVRARAEAATILPGSSDDPGFSGAAMPLMDHIRTLMQDVAAVRSMALQPDGRVKNARLMLAASEALRKNIESIMKIQATMAELGSLEKFHRAIMDELRAESPDLAARVVDRLTRLAGQWGA